MIQYILISGCLFVNLVTFPKQVQTTEVTTPSPAETWALWQSIDRHNTLLEKVKVREKRRLNREGRDIFENIFRRFSKGGTDNVIPNVLAGFAITTTKKKKLPTDSRLELNNYQASQPGSFMRGGGVDLNIGRYTCQLSGIYSFKASIRVSLERGITNYDLQDYIRANICIDGDCTNGMSLSTTFFLATNSRVSTVNIHGQLYMKVGNYASIFITNFSNRYVVYIHRRAYFSAVLIGS